MKYKKSKATKSAYIHNPAATLGHNYLANTVTLRHTLSLSHATPTASGNHSHRLSLVQHPPTTSARVRRPLLTSITKSHGLGPRGFPKTHHRARGHRPKSHTSTPPRWHSECVLRRRSTGVSAAWLSTARALSGYAQDNTSQRPARLTPAGPAFLFASSGSSQPWRPRAPRSVEEAQVQVLRKRLPLNPALGVWEWSLGLRRI